MRRSLTLRDELADNDHALGVHPVRGEGFTHPCQSTSLNRFLPDMRTPGAKKKGSYERFDCFPNYRNICGSEPSVGQSNARSASVAAGPASARTRARITRNWAEAYSQRWRCMTISPRVAHFVQRLVRRRSDSSNEGCRKALSSHPMVLDEATKAAPRPVGVQRTADCGRAGQLGAIMTRPRSGPAGEC